jgi:hypothetical protein
MSSIQPRQLTRHEVGALRAHLSLLAIRCAELDTRIPYLCVQISSCADRIDTLLCASVITGDIDEKVDAALKDAGVLLDRAHEVLKVDIHPLPLMVDAELVRVM